MQEHRGQDRARPRCPTRHSTPGLCWCHVSTLNSFTGHRTLCTLLTCLTGAPLLWGGGGKAGMWLIPRPGTELKPRGGVGGCAPLCCSVPRRPLGRGAEAWLCSWGPEAGRGGGCSPFGAWWWRGC